MGPGQGAKMRKSTLRNSVARVLVLGHQQAGKSAAIVRYTTGRFIQNYCSSTNDWLYRHPIGFDSARNQYNLVELLEQKDIEFSNSVSRDEQEQQQQQQEQSRDTRPAGCSLSSRVALDRQIDHEFYEKQQLLNKLHWANAYMILYALNDSSSFNKAIKYLNLIANEVNREPKNQNSRARRPILLVGNKCDLARSPDTRQARRVSRSDGRLLAMRHQCLFAELSISETAKPIEQALTNLLDSIRASELHTSRIDSPSSQLSEQILTQTQLTYWIPLPACQVLEQHSNQHNHTHPTGQQPVWSTLVKTRTHQSYSSSQNIVQSSCLAIKAKRLNEADFRLLTPVGMSLSSGSSSSSASSPAGSAGTASSALVKPQQPQAAQPLLASAAPVAVADVVQTPAMSVIESVSMAQRMVATRPSVSSTSSMSSAGAASSSSKSHLSSFRSSFRKGALAIVGSRSLAGRAATANKENERRLVKTGARSSLGSIQKQDTLSSVSYAASDSDTSSGGTIGPVRQGSSEVESAKKSPGQRINWIKSKISSLGRQETSASNSDTGSIGQQSLSEQQQQAVSRFRRPLFKYRTRRKTVAFEPTFETNEQGFQSPANESPSGSSLVPQAKKARDEEGHMGDACLVRVPGSVECMSANSTAQPGSDFEPLAECRTDSFSVAYELHGPSSARPSLSLSTNTNTNTNIISPAANAKAELNEAPSSVFIIGPAKSAFQGTASTSSFSPVTVERPAPNTRTNLDTNIKDYSHSTSSRASTSGGSNDEGSELALNHRVRSPTDDAHIWPTGTDQVKSVASGSPTALVKPAKARYQLVKTVQSTLNNLARATGTQSPPSSGLAQAAKRSFCSALFSRNNATLPTPVDTDGVQFAAASVVGASQMAQVERVQTLPLMGFCK